MAINLNLIMHVTFGYYIFGTISLVFKELIDKKWH
jgi:hypothetical protein